MEANISQRSFSGLSSLLRLSLRVRACVCACVYCLQAYLSECALLLRSQGTALNANDAATGGLNWIIMPNSHCISTGVYVCERWVHLLIDFY